MPTQILGKINAHEMYMHITPQEGSSSSKKKDLAFKASQEKRSKEKVALDSSSDDEVDDASSSGKGKKVVETDNYDDYVKLKSENEKLKKDLEKLSTTNTIVIENLDNDHDLALENEMLREENKRLKMEKDLEKLSTHDELREENKKLKLEKEHFKTENELVEIVTTDDRKFEEIIEEYEEEILV
ncbi:rRNA-processing protein EBP2-like [Miscanthus floridulus]|uniref:rRNA-processing protein EBP2-like n=1 Tax=Miscanthus floridulus TaxID=154761 RepID=UPI00345882A9